MPVLRVGDDLRLIAARERKALAEANGKIRQWNEFYLDVKSKASEQEQ